MNRFTQHTGIAVALVRNNIDTDVIIPSREMRSVSKLGLADGLFAPWRYSDEKTRRLNPDFALNKPSADNASILISGKNFGCGSSREHAVWALKGYGFRSIIAESFGSIFFRNCVRNGILPINASMEQINLLSAAIAKDPQLSKVSIDLVAKEICVGDGPTWSFSVADNDREMLLGGLDQIAETQKLTKHIDAFRQRDELARPWLR